MSDPAVDLSIPIGPVGPSTPPIMPPRLVDPPPPEQSLQTLEIIRPGQVAGSRQVERRTLVVGSGVSLSADINFCDRLFVNGDLEASIRECHELEVSSKGTFRGNATAETADIRGHFEGDLVIKKRLVIRSTARVSGAITYGQIEIETGAEVAGILMPEGRNGTRLLPPAFAVRPQNGKAQD